MELDSYSVGARADTFIDDTPVNAGINATWKAEDGSFDSIRVLLGAGDPAVPKGVEGTTTQDFRLLDGSTRQVELPSISSGKGNGEDKTRVSVGATLTGEPIGISDSPEFSVKPSVSAAVGTDGETTATTLRGTVGVENLDANVTLGSDGSVTGSAKEPTTTLEGTKNNASTGSINSGVLRENNGGPAAPTLPAPPTWP